MAAVLVGAFKAVAAEADLILSIMPPSAAVDAASAMATAIKASGKTPAFADCNAVSPQTALKAADVIASAGSPFIDAGIIGPVPVQVVDELEQMLYPRSIQRAVLIPEKVHVELAALQRHPGGTPT